MIGYATFYVKVESETDVAYSVLNFDFTNELSHCFYDSILNSVKQIYEKDYNMKVTNVDFCAKEEWEKYENTNLFKDKKIVSRDENKYDGYKVEETKDGKIKNYEIPFRNKK